MYEMGDHHIQFTAHVTQARMNAEDHRRATVLRALQRRKRSRKT